jgi:hypothetical protein
MSSVPSWLFDSCVPTPSPTGPPSSVQLSTPYLDERVRLGKGSRGSLFVFTRGGAADAAGEICVSIHQCLSL